MTPWAFRARPGGRIDRAEPEDVARDLEPGEVLLRFLAGGVCGSDVGALADLTDRGGGGPAPIAPLHEVVGEVVESRDARFAPGALVVGTGLTGLVSTLVERADRFIEVPSSSSVADAVAIQPISTVLRAVEALPAVAGLDVVVLGTGPIGLAFVHILKRFGAARVLAVDPTAGRADLAFHYGADEVLACTGQQWAADQAPRARPAIVVDAVGRQPDLISASLRSVADGGLVLGFGSAADRDYPIPYGEMYHRRLTLSSGRTRDGWVGVLERGAAYALAHRDDFADYVSHRFVVDDAQLAYDLCSRPDSSRVKVALVLPA